MLVEPHRRTGSECNTYFVYLILKISGLFDIFADNKDLKERFQFNIMYSRISNLATFVDLRKF